jgi:predicted nuclease of predicted toxin-antitoxin system
LQQADDSVVWESAKQQGFMIESKDSDFHQRSFVFGFPPKVIWVQLGNCTTSEVEQVIPKDFDGSKHFSKIQRQHSLSFLITPKSNHCAALGPGHVAVLEN